MAEFVEVVLGHIGGLTSYFSWGNVKIFAVTLGVVWAIHIVNQKVGVFALVGGVGERLFGARVEGLKAKGGAVAAEKSGDWLTAGLNYDQLGDLDKALDCYEKAGEYHLAGEMCLRLGHKEVAADWFLLSDEKLRAAQLYKELGQHENAADAYVKAGSSLEAAAEFLESGDFEKAAKIYARADNHMRAGEAYERGGDLAKAGESFARQVQEIDTRSSHYGAASQGAELARLSHRAGRCFEKAGETNQAIEIYERGGQVRLAAALAEKSGELRRAAELWRKAGSTRKAAELYEKAGDTREAANLLGDEKLSGGDAVAAAESFLKGGDHIRAAEIFETEGRFERASECYEQAGAFNDAAGAALQAEEKARAADLFLKAGNKEKSAELYFELGDFDLASLLFAKSNRFFDAAKSAAEANSETKMVEFLQQVPASDSNYPVAVVQLARAFVRRGWASLAGDKLRTVLAGQEVTGDNLELWDELARAEESEGNIDEAAEILHRVIVVRYDYRGANERYKKLQRQIENEKTRSETIKSAKPIVTHQDKARYEITGMLGKGGMGSVYKAFDRLLKRPVAYKVLAESLAKDPTAREQLLAEARAAAALNHPNIVTVYDLGYDGDNAFICMELIEGETYQGILRKKTWLDIPDALHWLVSVCQGLDHAHSRGIIHRDMKPSNVLLTADDRVKLLDFGLARPAEDEKSGESWAYSMSGTPKYISPEAIQGRPTDPRTDVYSLGATLYELLIGRAPFTEGDLLMHHLHTPPPPLRPKRTEINEKLEELVLLCLAKKPEERFQTTGEILSFADAAQLL